LTPADLLFDQAVCALEGRGGKSDPAHARALFRRAAEAGRLDAGVLYVNMLANGTGGPADWARAKDLLAMLAVHDAACAREHGLLAAMALLPEGDPMAVPMGERIGDARGRGPHVVRLPGLLTEAECRFLCDVARPMLEPAVVEEAAGRRMRHPGRTSDSLAFGWAIESPAIHALNRRMAMASGTRVEQGEPLQILRYAPGQHYLPHFDAIPGFHNQRVLTLLVWLTDDFEGGETHFLWNDLRLRGAAGDAILFRNSGPDGARDSTSQHAGLPVLAGEKWIASRWIRAQALPRG
jgi:prolyl 4-hydroxylase